MNLSSIFANSANNNANSGNNVPMDVYNKVSKIMQTQNTAAPKLNAALSTDKTTLSALGQLQSALASFQKVAQLFAGTGLSAPLSAKEVPTATVSNNSPAGSNAIGSDAAQITQLAQNPILRSPSLASADTPIGDSAAAVIRFDFGITSENTFSANSAGKTVNLPSGIKTLQGIATAVNGANIGVNAKVVPSGTGYALEFVSTGAGLGSMRIGVSNNPTLKDFLEYDPTGTKKLSQIAATQNTKLTVDGVPVEGTSNAATKAVPGNPLNPTAKGSGKLAVAQDSAQLYQNITSLVIAYNTLNAKLNTLQQGDLKSDGAALQIQNQLTRIFGFAGGATGNVSQALAKIGISIQKNGDLALDSKRLHNAVNADPAGVNRLFSQDNGGIAHNLTTKIQSMLAPSGSLPKKANEINQNIAALNSKKSSLGKALTKQAEALVKYYSQQSSLGNAMWATNSSNGSTSLFDMRT